MFQLTKTKLQQSPEQSS